MAFGISGLKVYTQEQQKISRWELAFNLITLTASPSFGIASLAALIAGRNLIEEAIKNPQKAEPPKSEDHILIPVDLNSGAGGDYIYLAFNRGEKDLITDLIVIEGQNKEVPSGYEKIDTDLNINVGKSSAYLYFCYNKNDGDPITDIVFQVRDNGNPPKILPGNYQLIDQDLNKGADKASGKKTPYIYAYIRKEQFSPTIDIATSRISDEMIKDPGKEYEISRVQIESNKSLVRLQKLGVESRKIPAGSDFTIERESKQGASKTDIESFAKELKVEVGAEIKGLSLGISKTLGWTKTTQLEIKEEETTKTTYKPPIVNYETTLMFYQALDILRIVEISSGNKVKELITKLPIITEKIIKG